MVTREAPRRCPAAVHIGAGVIARRVFPAFVPVCPAVVHPGTAFTAGHDNHRHRSVSGSADMTGL